jgi:allantoin racemase
MRILLVNPNTTSAVTDLCAREARTVAASGTEIVPLTGGFGARIISSRTENAIAAHALLTLLARHAGEGDAVLLAVSYDTGLLAARELLSVPVVGMTEAAMMASLLLGTRFGLVTFGTPSLYRELVRERGLSDRLAGVRTVATPASSAYTRPEGAEAEIAQAARRLVKDDGADAVVLCGAAMAGMARRLKDAIGVPLLDGIACGVPLCEMLVRLNARQADCGSLTTPAGRETIGLDPALAKRLEGSP